jgi:2-methylisocitrate lyase-like PEP mutase family enzyme
MTTAASRFRDLHRGSEVFVMPNAWDAGSARLLTQLGFQALGTTSAGLAFALGLPDAEGRLDRDVALENLSAIANATHLPVNGDLEAGYGRTPDEVAATYARAVDLGAAGAGIEDATGDRRTPLYEVEEAVERVRAARRGGDRAGKPFTLTARAECFLVGHPDPLRESIRRLQRYREAGADCLYAPGIADPQQLATLVKEVGGPVNALIGGSGPLGSLTVAELGELGVRRISVGAALARTALGAFLEAARQIALEGRFTRMAAGVPFGTLNDAFRDPPRKPA